MTEKIKTFSFFISLILIACTTASCGWKFKVVDGNLPFTYIFLEGTNNGVGKELLSKLRRTDSIKFSSSPEQTQVKVKLKVDNEKVVVGFSGAGRPRELELRITVRLEITDKENKPLQPVDELKIYRAINFNDTDVLATQAHEEFHIRDVNKQLAIQIFERLQRLEISKQNINK